MGSEDLFCFFWREGSGVKNLEFKSTMVTYRFMILYAVKKSSTWDCGRVSWWVGLLLSKMLDSRLEREIEYGCGVIDGVVIFLWRKLFLFCLSVFLIGMLLLILCLYARMRGLNGTWLLSVILMTGRWMLSLVVEVEEEWFFRHLFFLQCSEGSP